MVRGNQAAGYGVYYDEFGLKHEIEYRQCSHCQYTWVYQAGSGRQRGWCMHCTGLLCGRPECMKMTCAPFWDIVQDMGKGYVFNESAGIFIKK